MRPRSQAAPADIQALAIYEHPQDDAIARHVSLLLVSNASWLAIVRRIAVYHCMYQIAEATSENMLDDRRAIARASP